ncbi:MAG TPA: gliding motility-associated C-terminal domain-containing protein [Flavobacterium sp.]|nr:gliding motility-associated C-terminal domain-containing protein [Flavobacterium sp.]
MVSVTSPGTPNCTLPVTDSITITVLPLPVVSISSDTTICSGSEATVTFTGTPSATVTYTVNGGSNQTIILNSSGTATITNTYSANAIYSLVSVASSGTPVCSQPQTGIMTIVVEELPVVTIASDTNICVNESATITFTGTPNATVTYTIDRGVNQTIVLDGLGNASITNNYTQTTLYSLVSVSTSGTPGCSQPQTGTVTITVIPLPIVTISSDVDICSGDSATVTFTGTPKSIVTYTINNGPNQTIILNSQGEATVTNTYTTDTTFNLVSVSTSGTPSCSQTQSGSSKITIIPLPMVSISSDVLICSGDSVLVTFTGTPNTTVTYKVDNGSNQTILIDNSGIATINNTYSITTTYSLVSVALTNPPSCSQLQTGSMIINVVQPPVAGNNASLTLCSNSASQDLFLLLGSSAQTGGTWSPELASKTGVFDPAIDAPGTYVYTVLATFPCPNSSAAVSVLVTPEANSGTDGSAKLCSNENPVDLFTYIGGTPQTGGTWTPTLSSGTNIFNPAIDSAGKYTYTIIGVFPCSDDSSIVDVEIIPGPEAGISGEAVFCTNSAPQDLYKSLGGTPQTGGTWTPIMASGTGVFNPAIDLPGVYTYSFAGSDPCDSDSATVTVTVNPVPDAGTDGTAFFCSNYKPSDLFLNLGGNPQTGGTWSPALASGTGVFNPAVDLPGEYIYTVGGNYCDTSTAKVTVTVTQSPNAGGANAPLLIKTCETVTAVDLFTGLNGTQSAGVWNDDDKTGALTNNIFNPSIPGDGTYHFTYTVSGGTSPCLTDSATVTVEVSTSPNAGTFTGIQNVCKSVGTFDLFTLLINYQNTGVWTDNAGQTITNPISILSLNPNTYTYTYTVTNSCGVDVENVQLIVLQNPDITGAILNASTTCINFSNEVLVSGANSLANGSYTINYQLSGAVTTSLSAVTTFTSGTGSFIIPASEINNSGFVTVTVLDFKSNENQCTTIASTIFPITFEVIKVDTPELKSEGNEFCGTDKPTIADLSANIVSGEPVIWFNAPSGGTPYAETELLQNNVTYYATYLPVSNCESISRIAVTVDLTVCDDIVIPDGFSPNGDGINDEFVIKNIDILFPNYELEIYNRYGNLIYKGNSNTPDWDGTTNSDGITLGNNGVPVGVYFYILNFNDGITKSKQGRVYLSR